MGVYAVNQGSEVSSKVWTITASTVLDDYIHGLIRVGWYYHQHWAHIQWGPKPQSWVHDNYKVPYPRGAWGSYI